jgi:hypothetical protein
MTTMHLTFTRGARLCALVAVGLLALGALAACGSSSNATSTISVAPTTAAVSTSAAGTTGSTVSGAESTMSSAATQLSGSPMVGQFSGPALQIATCVQQQTTGQVVTDLSNGKTDSAQKVYNDCIASALPAPLASQAQPVVNDAVACGQQATKALNSTDLQAAESGDTTQIQALTNQTITCLANKYGALLQ